MNKPIINGIPKDIDTISYAQKSIDIAHARIHTSQHYNLYDTSAITTGNNKDYHLVTPNTTTRMHCVHSVSTDGKATITFYEGATTSANGTALTIFNNDRNSANTATLAIYEDPTVTGVGTALSVELAGSSQKAGGEVRSEGEFILKQNTKYLLRITAGANIDQVTQFHWYEVP